MKIVVMGGSFNPPTIAHEKLMETSIKAINADLGIFVPSSDKYVTRKMNKVKKNNQVYSEYDRQHMLNIICDKLTNCAVDTCEFGDDGRGYTYKTLCEIQRKHPDSEIYFICGADKLDIIPKWHSAEELLTKFKFIVTAREEDNPHEQIKNNKVLSKYANKFVVIEQPKEIDKISSTEVRAFINSNNKQVYNLCDKDVVNYIIE